MALPFLMLYLFPAMLVSVYAAYLYARITVYGPRRGEGVGLILLGLVLLVLSFYLSIVLGIAWVVFLPAGFTILFMGIYSLTRQ